MLGIGKEAEAINANFIGLSSLISVYFLQSVVSDTVCKCVHETQNAKYSITQLNLSH